MSIFDEYQRLPDAKPLWQVAFESGCGSVELLRQIGKGLRRANAAQAVGIELSTGGVVTRQQLRPHDCDVIWGAAKQVHDRMREVQANRKAVYARFVSPLGSEKRVVNG